MKKEEIVKFILSIIITLASLCFVAYGAVIIFSKGAPIDVIFFGVLSFSYGALSIVRLISIYIKKNIIPIKVTNYFGLLFLLGFFLASLDVGIISGLEWFGILILAIFVAAISFSFKRLGKINNVA